MTGHEFVRPVIISASNGSSQSTWILRRDVDARRKNQLKVNTLPGVVFHPVVHVIAALLPAHDLVAALVGFRFVKNLVRHRLFEVGVRRGVVLRRQIMLELRIKIFAFANPFRRIFREWLGQLIDLVQQPVVTEVGI